MGKSKEKPKYMVLSLRVTDEEKALMDELKRSTKKSVSRLLREAMQLYSPRLKLGIPRGE